MPQSTALLFVMHSKENVTALAAVEKPRNADTTKNDSNGESMDPLVRRPAP
jgi:hypothetical protein